MTVGQYFCEIARELHQRSDAIRLGFSTHPLSAGENRESLVADFLRNYLPKVFGIDTGIILSTSGEFSTQADLVIVDQDYNAPLYPTQANKVWLVESVYALIEVKTYLRPSDIADAFEKGRRFKTLPREFDTVPVLPKIRDSLFVLWAFESPSPDTVKRNIESALMSYPRDEQPDFIIVPNKMLVSSGCYRMLSKIGQSDSSQRRLFTRSNPNKTYEEVYGIADFMILGEYSLLTWLIWTTSWLKGAGHRSAPLASYLQKTKCYGYQL